MKGGQGLVLMWAKGLCLYILKLKVTFSCFVFAIMTYSLIKGEIGQSFSRSIQWHRVLVWAIWAKGGGFLHGPG